MANNNNLQKPFCFFIFVGIYSLLVNNKLCSCLSLNATIDAGANFLPAMATWYGSANGAGSDGGACGYTNAVSQPPYSSMTSAGNPNLYKSGKGCGTCYQVKCTENRACSGSPVTVTITDECPGCTDAPFHFDLSGTAFGIMAKPGQANNLRGAGKLNIGYKRVPCNYRGTKLAFRIDAGSTPNYIAFVVEYVNGDGDLASVELGVGNKWIPMQLSWGATWKVNLGPGAKAPFSVWLTAGESKKKVLANNVIPANWAPGNTYRATVNF